MDISPNKPGKVDLIFSTPEEAQMMSGIVEPYLGRFATFGFRLGVARSENAAFFNGEVRPVAVTVPTDKLYDIAGDVGSRALELRAAGPKATPVEATANQAEFDTIQAAYHQMQSYAQQQRSAEQLTAQEPYVRGSERT